MLQSENDLQTVIDNLLLSTLVLYPATRQTSNPPGDSGPLQPRFRALQLLAFPKLKSPLKGKRFQTIDEIQESMMGQLMAIGRAV